MKAAQALAESFRDYAEQAARLIDWLDSRGYGIPLAPPLAAIVEAAREGERADQ